MPKDNTTSLNGIIYSCCCMQNQVIKDEPERTAEFPEYGRREDS